MFGKLIDNRPVFRAVHDEYIVLLSVASPTRNTQLKLISGPQALTQVRF